MTDIAKLNAELQSKGIVAPQAKGIFQGRSFLSMDDFSRAELDYVLSKAEYLKKALENNEVTKFHLVPENKDLIAACLFYENSTRTNTSFTIACMRLGLRVVGFSGVAGTSVQKGESLRHTLDMYEAYQCCAVVLRHPCDGAAQFAADHLKIPVFNAGDGKHEHPTQTILDLFTVKEHLGRLDDFDMAMVLPSFRPHAFCFLYTTKSKIHTRTFGT